MIKAYLAGIPSLYEGEDIEIQYSIYDEQELICKETRAAYYVKPVLVGQVALTMLLKKLKNHKDSEVVIIINDNLLYESIRGTLRTKKADLIRKADETRKQLAEFKNVKINDISGNHKELMIWSEALKS